jgi:hypothetical protein
LTDEIKVNHRDSFKGHRTKKHFLRKIEAEEAEKEIKDEILQDQRRGS